MNHHLQSSYKAAYTNCHFSESGFTCAARLLPDSSPHVLSVLHDQREPTPQVKCQKSDWGGEMCLAFISGDWGEKYISVMAVLIS